MIWAITAALALSPSFLLPFHSTPPASMLFTINSSKCLLLSYQCFAQHLALRSGFLPDICQTHSSTSFKSLLKCSTGMPFYIALCSSVASQIRRYLQIEGWGNSASHKPMGTISLTEVTTSWHLVILTTFQAFSLAVAMVICDH